MDTNAHTHTHTECLAWMFPFIPNSTPLSIPTIQCSGVVYVDVDGVCCLSGLGLRESCSNLLVCNTKKWRDFTSSTSWKRSGYASYKYYVFNVYPQLHVYELTFDRLDFLTLCYRATMLPAIPGNGISCFLNTLYSICSYTILMQLCTEGTLVLKLMIVALVEKLLCALLQMILLKLLVLLLVLLNLLLAFFLKIWLCLKTPTKFVPALTIQPDYIHHMILNVHGHISKWTFLTWTIHPCYPWICSCPH